VRWTNFYISVFLVLTPSWNLTAGEIDCKKLIQEFALKHYADEKQLHDQARVLITAVVQAEPYVWNIGDIADVAGLELLVQDAAKRGMNESIVREVVQGLLLNNILAFEPGNLRGKNLSDRGRRLEKALKTVAWELMAAGRIEPSHEFKIKLVE
jgi:hypothetical protein